MKLPKSEEELAKRIFPRNSKMFLAYKDAEKIEENRRRIFQQMIPADFSSEQICQFFEMKEEHLISYLELMDMDESFVSKEGNEDFFLRLRALRDKAVLEDLKKAEEQGLLVKDAIRPTLTKFGLYNIPSTVREQMLSSYRTEIEQMKKKLPKRTGTKVYEKEAKKIQKQEDFLEHIEKILALQNSIASATDKEKELIQKFGFSYEMEKMNRDYNLTVLDNMVNKGESLKHMNRFAAFRLQKKMQSNFSQGETPFAYKSASRREQCFLYYMAGYTQEAIGQKLGITRETVGTDLKSYRKEFPDRWDKTFLCRRRNTATQILDEKEAIRQTVPSLHYAGMSTKEISELTKLSEPEVLRLKIEQKLNSSYIQEKEQYEIKKKEEEVLELLDNGISFKEMCSLTKLGSTQTEIHLAKRMRQLTPDKFFETYENQFSYLEKERLLRRYEQLESVALTWNGMNRNDSARLQGRSYEMVKGRNNEVKNYIRKNSKSLDFMRQSRGKWETFQEEPAPDFEICRE